MPKIFVIGMNKTATTTFHNLFEKNGLRSQHTTRWNTDDYDCFSDNGDLNNFKKLEQKYNDAVFILNIRPMDKWVVSRFDHGARQAKKENIDEDKDYVNWGYPYSIDLSIKYINRRNLYHQQILKYFQNKPEKLIIVDIEKPGWVEYISNILKFKNANIESLNVHEKSEEYSNIVSIVNKTFAIMFCLQNYDPINKNENLINDQDKKKEYLQIYRNNMDV